MRIIVTRHRALIEYLVEAGIVTGSAGMLTHVDSPEQIRGQDVIGVLPLHLAALCASITEIPLELTPEDRGTELTIERLRSIAGKPRTFVVRGVLSPEPPKMKVHHSDHGVSPELILECLTTAPGFSPSGFFACEFLIPADAEPVMSALYGPSVGDDPVDEVCVHYARRTPDRPPSRLVNRPLRESRSLVIIGVRGSEGWEIYTAYGGGLAPREPGDASLLDPTDVAESAAFWASHALSSQQGGPCQ